MNFKPISEMRSYLFIVICFLFPIAVLAQASIVDAKKNMLTYDFSDPDPVAKPGRVYPYFRFDGYTDKGVQKEWQFINLENDFIKVSITPEIGGKIWGATEKASNFPFVYYNNVVKFRDVAMRGAWTSGGIEMNFGDIGHDPTVSHPVDYFTKTNKDGSISCFLGSFDWASRTRWMVEVNLPKDEAQFTTKSKWFNGSGLQQTYYHWMNAGFRAEGNLEFAFPGSGYIGHNGDLHPWPTTREGREIAYYNNNDFGSYKSYHVLGKETDFFGAYWHDNKIGFAHYSPYYDKLGKKIWIWGLSQEGMIWEDLLTDSDGQYVELQSGRLFNQAAGESKSSPFKHVAFDAYAADHWSESWFPVKEIGGITEAMDWGASNIKLEGQKLNVNVSAAKTINGILKITNDSRQEEHSVNLKPLETLSISSEVDTSQDITVYLFDQVLFSNIKVLETSSERPLEAPTDFDWDSEYGMYLDAQGLYNQRLFMEAEAKARLLLNKNPYHVPSLGLMAQLMYRSAKFEEATAFAKKALSINTYDGTCNYMLGLSQFRLGNYRTASEAFSVAVLSPAYKSAAYTELAKLRIIQKDFYLVKDLIENALTFNANNEHALHLKLVYLRKTNQKALALELIDQLLEADPLDHFLRFEKYILTEKKETLEAFKTLIRNELPHENFIEMAIWYNDIHEKELATELLQNAPSHPMVDFWLYEITTDKSYLEKAVSQSPYLVFPFRVEEESLFKKLSEYSTSWKVNYYYGLLLWQLNRTDEAKVQFEKCGNQADYYPFYLSKAQLFQENKGQVELALLKAKQLAPGNWRVVKELASFYKEKGDFPKALAMNEAFAVSELHEQYILGQQKAEILAAMGSYKEVVDFMKTLKFLPNEGAKGAHSLFRSSCLNQAVVLLNKGDFAEAQEYLHLSQTWPMSLGSGEPYSPDNKLSNALKLMVLNKKSDHLETLKPELNKMDQSILDKLKY